MASPTSAAPPRAATGASGRVLTVQKVGPLKAAVRDQGRELHGHWVYVFYRLDDASLKVAAEVHAQDAEHWHVWTEPEMSTPNEQRRAAASKTYPGYVPLERRYAHEPHGYGFFISRVQITGEALELVTAKPADLVWHTLDMTPDPRLVHTFESVEIFRYTETFHQTDYLPQLGRHMTWITDRERQGKYFIAGVLDGWIGGAKGEDPLKLRKHLKEQPSDWLERYEREEKDLRVIAEKAVERMIETCVKTPQHRAQEWSMQTAGGAQIHLALQHWARVAKTLLWTAPGRVFALELLQDPHRVVRSHLFTDRPVFPKKPGPDHKPGEFASPEPNAFQLFRKGTTAAISLLADLLPAQVELLQHGADRTMSTWSSRKPGELQRSIAQYLDNLGIETRLTKAQQTIQVNLKTGKPITSGLEKGGRERKTVLQEWERLTLAVEADVRADVKAKRDLAGRLEARQAELNEAIGADAWGGHALLVIEIANLCIAINELRAATPEAEKEKAISLIGSSLDATTSLMSVLELYWKVDNKIFGIHEQVWKGLGGGLGFASSLIDFRDASNGALQAAFMENNPGKAVGQTITATGYSLGAISAGLAVGKIIGTAAGYGSAFGPAGAMLGVISAVLVIGGMVVVEWFSESDYQAFARHCFLGEDAGEYAEASWSSIGLGGPVVAQVEVLYELLYQPQVSFHATARRIPTLAQGSFESEGTGFRLTIVPGLFDAESTRYVVDLEVKDLDGKTYLLNEKQLELPAPGMALEPTRGGAEAFVRRWPRASITIKKPEGVAPVANNFHWYALPFSYTVQPTRDGERMGKPIARSGRIGGKVRSPSGVMEWRDVDFNGA